jgi:hypothetical protein
MNGPLDLRWHWKLLLHYSRLACELPQYDKKDFLQMGRRMRALSINYRVLHERADLHEILSLNGDVKNLKESVNNHIETLSNLLFPVRILIFFKIISLTSKKWIIPKYKSIVKLQKSSQSRGIVFTTGIWHFELCLHLILTLKKVIKTTLPMEVFHAGPKDLPLVMRKALHSLNVRTVDIWDHFDTEARDAGGWSIKPFAILASSFKEVIFIDADALFLQDPLMIFETSKIYAETGSFFYTDRSLGGGYDDASWFKSFVPFPSMHAQSNRFMNALTAHEMESGAVVLNKGNAGVFMGLLTV